MEEQKRNLQTEFNIPDNNTNDIKRLKKITNGYKTNLAIDDKFSTLINLAKMHEASLSSSEFENSSEFIGNGETENYIKQKKGLQRVPLLKKH